MLEEACYDEMPCLVDEGRKGDVTCLSLSEALGFTDKCMK